MIDAVIFIYISEPHYLIISNRNQVQIKAVVLSLPIKTQLQYL